MSALVKGMEKPEHCGYCRFRYDGICHALQKTRYSMDECPLVGIDDAGMSDSISRQAAIKAICEDGTWLESQGCTEITMAERKQRDADILGELPSAERKGKWINHRNDCGHNIADCSECGSTIQWFDDDEKPKFCCMCGSRNKEEEEDEDIH